MADRFEQRRDWFDRTAEPTDKLRRGRVWCRTCGRSEAVDSAECLRSGWPKCCGYTMTIDAPDERKGADNG